MLKELVRRSRAALALLFLPGDRMPVTRHELMRFRAEWEEWQITFTGMLEQLNTFHARIAKREKRIMQAREAELSSQGATSGGTVPASVSRGLHRKADIYRRAVAASGGQLSLIPPGARTPPPHPSENGDEP